ncbi:MAG: peptidoglycan-binding protein LysM [Pseudomonadota bacterium]|nr:peptidoglycan-binding protein LysM [Pseudomonadota bacterium]
MLESWHVVMRCCTRWLLAGGLVTYSVAASALGLGELTIHSALNQPLRADIALVDAAGLEEGDLSVSLATAEEFGRAGVERVFFLNDLKFTPILRGNRAVIRVSSGKPVNEPFLNFLVQLNQPNGRLLREYTVLIDPPGAPGIVPAADEPDASAPNSPFPKVTPAAVPPASAKKPAAKTGAQQPAPPVIDPGAEQLAASVLQNQQLQKNLDELNAKLLAQDEQIAGQKKQIVELQTRLAEVQQAPPVAVPAAPVSSAPAPTVVEESEPADWPMIIGLLALVSLLLLGFLIRRRRQQVEASPLHSVVLAEQLEPVLDREDEPAAQASALKHAPLHHEETPSGDVLEGVGIYIAYGRFSEASALLREALVKEPQRTDLALRLLEVLGKQGDVPAYDAQEQSLIDSGFDPHQLQEIRERYPKMTNAPTPVIPAVPIIATTIAPIVAPLQPADAPPDEFQLNLDDLSMDSNWDLISPFDETSSASQPARPDESVFSSNLQVMPVEFDMSDEPTLDEAELEWVAEPDAESLDDAFLDEFSDPLQSFELEPLGTESIELEPAVPAHADKLEQAQTCIDDGDLDSAIELLNELLEDGDEPLKQTARTLLAGIR